MKSRLFVAFVIALAFASPARALLLAPVQAIPTKPAAAAPPQAKAVPVQAVAGATLPQVTSNPLEIGTFVSIPAVPSPGTESVTLRLTVRNLTNSSHGKIIGDFFVYVRRTDSVQTYEKKIVRIDPGATQTFDFGSVPVRVGNNDFTARFKFRHGQSDSSHQERLESYEKALRLTIAPLSTHLVTQVLDYEKAKQAGAQFSQSAATNPNTGAPGSCPVFGQFYDPTVSVGGPPPMPFSVRFRIDCGGSSTGMRPSLAVAFGGLRLKHGWKVKTVERFQEANNSGHIQWVVQPAPRGDDPKLSAQLSAAAGGSAHAIVRVTIEGPEGSDPYQ